ELAPGGHHDVPLAAFAPGAYRWRTRQRPERGTLEVALDGQPGPAVYRFTADGVEEPAATGPLAPGATARFENAGDTPLLLIMEHRGALVKTIGDAVMAVFHAPADAVAAGLAIQAGIAAYNAAAPGDPLCVKLGLHSGPCIAINANDVLDYFGTTVNVAARVQ